ASSVEVGSEVTEELTFSNLGQMPLEWAFVEDDADAMPAADPTSAPPYDQPSVDEEVTAAGPGQLPAIEEDPDVGMRGRHPVTGREEGNAADAAGPGEAITITHSDSMDVDPGHSYACQSVAYRTTTANQFMRV